MFKRHLKVLQRYKSNFKLKKILTDLKENVDLWRFRTKDLKAFKNFE